MPAWRVEGLALGQCWEFNDRATGRYARLVVGYDASRLGWYVSAKYAVGQGLRTGQHQTYDLDETGIQKCMSWARSFLAETGVPAIDFRPSLYNLVRLGRAARPSLLPTVARRIGAGPAHL